MVNEVKDYREEVRLFSDFSPSNITKWVQEVIKWGCCGNTQVSVIAVIDLPKANGIPFVNTFAMLANIIALLCGQHLDPLADFLLCHEIKCLFAEVNSFSASSLPLRFLCVLALI